MRVHVRLLGGFDAKIDGRMVATSALARRPRELVELLALAPGHCLTRDEAIEALFGHLDAEAGAANLHKAASLVRKQFGHPDAVVIARGVVELWPSAEIQTDLGRFEATARAALETGDPARCRQVADRYGGDVLPGDRYEAWSEPARRRARQLEADLLRAAGEWERLVEFDPADEAAHQELMRRHAATGRRSAVSRQFHRLRHALAAELGVPPSAGTVELYHELSRGAATTAPLDAARPMVGRQVEMARARGVLGRAAGGHGGGLLVRGEAGIGKTRLCEALLADAAAAEWTTLRGSASRVDATIPYSPVVEAVDRLLRDRPDLADRLDDPARSVLGRLTTAVVRDASPQPLTHQEVVSVVARLLAGTAKERGVVLFVDDFHDADADTISLVHHLTRTAIFQPVLVVVAMRSGGESPAALQARTDLLDTRRATEIELGPLTAAETSVLVGQVTADRWSSEAIAAMSRRAGGNPFLLEELASGDLQRATSAVIARLERLEPHVRNVLAAAAVLGETVVADELSAVSGMTGDETLRIIDVASGAGILDDDDGGHRFRHGVVREVLLRQVGAHRRSRAHRTAAAVLSAAGAPAARVAHHFLAAGQPRDAGPHLRAAARAAMAVGAYRDAVGFVERALALGDTDAELLTLRADLAFATGDPAAPLRYAEAIGVVSAADQSALRVRQARALVAAYDPAAARAALAMAAETSPDQALRHLIEAQVAWMVGELDTCERVVERARTLALAHGEMEVVFGAMSLRDLVLHQQGRWPDALRRDLLEAGDSPVLASVVYDAHLCGAEAYLYGGRPYSEVKAFATELAATAEAAGASRGLAFARTLLGEAEMLSGELGAAETHLVESSRLHAEVAAPGGQALALQRLAEVYLATGRRTDAEKMLATALPLARANPALAWHLVARVYGTLVRTGTDPVATIAVIDEGELGIAAGMAQCCPPCSISFLLPAATACADAADLERARRFLARAEPWVSALWAQTGWRAALDESRAHVARAEGQLEIAKTLLADAAERFGAVGQPVDARRCQAARATLA